MQDNDGPGNTASTVTSASDTLARLVAAVEARTGVDYAFIDNPFIGDDTNGGEPGGNIRVAFIYRTDRVELVPGSVATVTNPADQQTNPANPFFDARPPLAAKFRFGGEEVTVIGNHFSSKGGSTPLVGTVQPPTNNGEDRRVAQADAVNDYVDGLLAADASANVVVIGDINDFEFEEPLQVLEGDLDLVSYSVPGGNANNAQAVVRDGSNVVLTNLTESLPEDERYSYVFEGSSQALDHALITNNLVGSAAYDVVHINSEYSDQLSDHDPLVVQLDLRGRTVAGGNGNDALQGGGGRDVLTGGNGNDTLRGLSGDDRLEGGNGNDQLFGGFGRDRLQGGNGDDRLFGEDGNDVLLGENGDDQLVGGRGNDTLTGGNGDDVFVLRTPSDGVDTITDFRGDDLIALSIEGFGVTVDPRGGDDDDDDDDDRDGDRGRGARGDDDDDDDDRGRGGRDDDDDDDDEGSAFRGVELDDTNVVFVRGTAARAADPTLLFDQRTGVLTFDADGTGAAAAVELVRFTAGTRLDGDDFLFI